jgi:hypothetical protein
MWLSRMAQCGRGCGPSSRIVQCGWGSFVLSGSMWLVILHLEWLDMVGINLKKKGQNKRLKRAQFCSRRLFQGDLTTEMNF